MIKRLKSKINEIDKKNIIFVVFELVFRLIAKVCKITLKVSELIVKFLGIILLILIVVLIIIATATVKESWKPLSEKTIRTIIETVQKDPNMKCEEEFKDEFKDKSHTIKVKTRRIKCFNKGNVYYEKTEIQESHED